MTMAVDTHQHPQMNGIGYDAMRFPAPQFTNPWVSTTIAGSNHLYATSGNPENSSQPQMSRPFTYSALPITTPPLATGVASADQLYPQGSLPGVSQNLLHAPRPYGYGSSAATTTGGYAPTSAPQYTNDFRYGYSQERRSPHPSVMSDMLLGLPVEGAQGLRQDSVIDFDRIDSHDAERHNFSDALDASRGIMAMSQDITPRNIYGNQGSSRSSSDSYGFPSAHSSHSSISSASTYPSYYNSSASEASVCDYSSAGESVEAMPHRTLPMPTSLIGGALPPAPSSMMGQFSSKVSSSSQKKHKCKICDKRFTRPSSLQTHMYSHTGEKPFACDVDGCGRHFSVVSNLRRHRKVHKGELGHPSPDDE
ncbi:hypothetical protein LTR50_006279 [Elasticomyces elasticus]|nr:hypothetical protein LTR50_006279 [Elasticomyces elasticus]